MELAIERAWLSVNDPITSNIMPSFCQMTALAIPVLSPTYRPCTPWTVTGWEIASSAGTGTGSVLDGSPIARIAAASWGEMPGCGRRYARSSSTVTPSLEMVGAFACPTISVGMSGYELDAVGVPVGAPQICTTAGPPVMKSLLPSIFAGSGGAVRFRRAADCRVASALNVNVALD